MRSLRKNCVTVWYALYGGKTTKYDENGDETGDPIEYYEAPVSFLATPSVGSGHLEPRVFGADITYSRTLTTTDLTIPIDVSSLIWIETEPVFKSDGTVDADSADYVVSAKPLKSKCFLTFALSQRVKNVSA